MRREPNRKPQPNATQCGTYGCRKCGTYARLCVGEAMICRRCRSALPLVMVSDGAVTGFQHHANCVAAEGHH